VCESIFPRSSTTHGARRDEPKAPPTSRIEGGFWKGGPAPSCPSLYQGPDYLAAIADGAFDPLVHPDPFQPPWLYRAGVALVRLLVRRLLRFRVAGLEHVPSPPFIIASNHQAWYDTVFILAAFPRLPMIYTMARRDTVFNRAWKRWLMPRLGVFPIAPAAESWTTTASPPSTRCCPTAAWC
jgi:hypothetical protein